MKLNAKKLITLVLTAAIALSGAMLDQTIVASATTIDGMEVTKIIPDSTMTLKLGDTKRLCPHRYNIRRQGDERNKPVHMVIIQYKCCKHRQNRPYV